MQPVHNPRGVRNACRDYPSLGMVWYPLLLMVGGKREE
jgi:hypothetical protein